MRSLEDVAVTLHVQAKVAAEATKAGEATKKAVEVMRDEVRQWKRKRPSCIALTRLCGGCCKFQLKGFTTMTATLTQGHDEATQVLSIRLDALKARMGQSLSTMKAALAQQRRKAATVAELQELRRHVDTSVATVIAKQAIASADQVSKLREAQVAAATPHFSFAHGAADAARAVNDTPGDAGAGATQVPTHISNAVGTAGVSLVVPPTVSQDEFADVVRELRDEISQARGGIGELVGSVGQIQESMSELNDATSELRNDMATESREHRDALAATVLEVNESVARSLAGHTASMEEGIKQRLAKVADAAAEATAALDARVETAISDAVEAEAQLRRQAVGTLHGQVVTANKAQREVVGSIQAQVRGAASVPCVLCGRVWGCVVPRAPVTPSVGVVPAGKADAIGQEWLQTNHIRTGRRGQACTAA